MDGHKLWISVAIIILCIMSYTALAEPVEIVIEYGFTEPNITQVFQGNNVTMPQVNAMHTLDEDGGDGYLLYLYGTYQIENDNQALTQIHSSTYPNPAINHKFINIGQFNYTAVIMYAELQYNYTSSNWDTIGSGIDNSITQLYNVTAVPPPNPSFILTLLNTLKMILCSIFPSFPFC